MVSATDSVTGEAARKNLAGARVKMKKLYDRHSQCRQFTKGDQVMALLPGEATPFQARFAGPYTIIKQVSEPDTWLQRQIGGSPRNCVMLTFWNHIMLVILML